jgi:hypothetical protein
MIRRYAACAVAASTLFGAWPAGAAAKAVPASVGLCGPSACVHLSGRAVRRALARTEGGAVAPAPALAPYFRVTTRPYLYGLTGYLVPSQGVVVLGTGTYRLGARALRRARSRLAAVAPYRPRVTRVWVGRRAAADPSIYAAILRRPSIRPPSAIWRRRSMSIGMMLADAGPWAAWGSVRYFPAGRLMHVPDGDWVRVTPAQAATIAADARSTRPSGGRPGSALPIAIGLGACALAAVAIGRRPRRQLRGA